jgi:hypothetical protein
MLGYQGSTCCSLAQAQPYVNWLFNLPASYFTAAQGLGMHPLPYTNGQVARSPSSCAGCTPWWQTLQDNPQYIARDCSGSILSPDGNSSISEFADISQSGWRSIWDQFWVTYPEFNSSPGTMFVDAAGDQGGPYACGAGGATYASALASMFSAAPYPVIANNVFESSAVGTDWHTIDAPSNVIGAMVDSDCFVDANAFGQTGDFAITQGNHSYGYSVDDWTQHENDALYLASQNKMFVCLIGASGFASSEPALRTYAYASLMLTFNLLSTTYFTYWQTDTAGQVEVYPETGLVPANPVVGTPSSIAALQVGGVYAREYKDCFYRGTDEGPCAFVVNPTIGAQNWPTLSRPYGHTMTLSGGGVLEGGTASFAGPSPTPILFSGSAVIVVR